MDRIIIGISGASGAAYGVKCLDLLKENDIETHLIITKAAALTIENEGLGSIKSITQLADFNYNINDIGAPIASGSFKTKGMIIAPCSIKTMSEIANGITSNILSRAADVILKERRPLVLMLRETPYHLGHIETMKKLTLMGAIIFPPVPAFYSGLKSIDDMVTQSSARSLDLLGIDIKSLRRWGEEN